ncbi:MAG: BlaI/MecI/CopY family transcriptional regulator [Wujia sp.]
MKKLPQITKAEYEVMKIIWKHAPISTNDITNHLLETTNWNARTIHTLIKRLTSKGAITYEKQSRYYVYTPLFDEKEYIKTEREKFVEKFYNGNILSMMTSFIKEDKLTAQEIKELRDLLSNRPKKE